MTAVVIGLICCQILLAVLSLSAGNTTHAEPTKPDFSSDPKETKKIDESEPTDDELTKTTAVREIFSTIHNTSLTFQTSPTSGSADEYSALNKTSITLTAEHSRTSTAHIPSESLPELTSATSADRESTGSSSNIDETSESRGLISTVTIGEFTHITTLFRGIAEHDLLSSDSTPATTSVESLTNLESLASTEVLHNDRVKIDDADRESKSEETTTTSFKAFTSEEPTTGEFQFSSSEVHSASADISDVFLTTELQQPSDTSVEFVSDVIRTFTEVPSSASLSSSSSSSSSSSLLSSLSSGPVALTTELLTTAEERTVKPTAKPIPLTVTVLSVSSRSIDIIWNVPTEYHHGVYHAIEVNENDKFSYYGNSTVYRKDNLVPGKEYMVGVAVCKEDDICDDVVYAKNTTFPAPPSNVSLAARTDSSLKLVWTQEGSADYFRVAVDDRLLDRGVAQFQDGTSIVMATINGLTVAGAAYRVSLSACTAEDLCSEISTETLRTEPAKPGPLHLLRRTTDSLMISFRQLGQFDNFDVFYKTLIKFPEWSRAETEETTTGSEMLKLALTGLPVAGDLYNISVAAISGHVIGQSQWGTYRTVPTTPVLKCIGTDTSITICIRSRDLSTAITFSYSYHFNISSTIAPFTTHRSLLVSPASLQAPTACIMDPVDGAGGRAEAEGEEAVEGSHGVPVKGWVVAGLMPGTSFEVVVSAVVVDVSSDPGTITCSTRVSKPLDVRVSDISETAIKVTWRKPQGHFDRFKVECLGGSQNVTQEVASSPVFDSGDEEEDPGDRSSDVKSSNETKMATDCVGLTPGSLYHVTVSTVATAPASIATGPVVSHVTIPKAPEFLQVIPRNDSIEMWLHPGTSATCHRYKVQVSAATAAGAAGAAAAERTISCSVSSYILNGLSDNSKYQLTVIAQSDYQQHATRESEATIRSVWTLANAVSSLSVSGPMEDLTITWSQPNGREWIMAYVVSIENTGALERPRIILLKCVDYQIECYTCTKSNSVVKIDCTPLHISYVFTPPIHSASNYSVSVSAVNAGGAGEAAQLYYAIKDTTSFASSSSLVIGAVVGCISGVAVSLIVVLLVLRLKRTKRTKPSSKRPSLEMYGFSNPSFSRSEVDDCLNRPSPIPIDRFVEHVQYLHRDSDYSFAAEYAWQDRRLQDKMMYLGDEVHHLGTSRVKLIPMDDDDEGADYINASYVQGFSSVREFIATQGPLKCTIDHFWQMIWEQNVYMIVMVTNLEERSKVKCAQYWPINIEEDVRYGKITVHMLSQTPMDDYVLRLMVIHCGDRNRTVKQFHFNSWPDFGCPDNTTMLLDFVRRVQRARAQLGADLAPATPGPLVVHCSAGVGRTGTFILVDRLLQMIKKVKMIDIFGVVLEMRTYRTHMIQTEAQYIFAHECIRTAVENKLHLANDLINYNEDDSDDNKCSKSGYNTDDD